MGIFSRIGTLFKSNINDMITRAEDPQKMLNQVLVDMKRQLVEAKKQVAAAIADEKRLRKQADNEREKAGEWERKAMLAVRAGEDDLAKEALTRKGEHAGHLETMQNQWQSQKVAVDKLKEQLRRLSNKIDEAKRKKNILIARQKRAEAQSAIHETMAGLNDASAFDTFDRMAGQIDAMEAQAEAHQEISGTVDTLESRFKALESAESGSDHQLLELKEKMGLLSESSVSSKNVGQLGPGEPKSAHERPVDDELEALKKKLDAE